MGLNSAFKGLILFSHRVWHILCLRVSRDI